MILNSDQSNEIISLARSHDSEYNTSSFNNNESDDRKSDFLNTSQTDKK